MKQVIYKERKQTDCVKWDGCKEKFGMEELLPLWVADMDFEAPVCVKEALKNYVDFGVYGYYQPPKAYFEAFENWEEKYHDYKVEDQWIRFAPGVVPAFNWLIQILTKEKDGVIIMSPVYYPFRDAIINNERMLVESPLSRTKEGYEIDYIDFEQKIQKNDVKLFIFCSPHNPVGRVWTKEELTAIGDLCIKYGVTVVSDEIHGDFIFKGEHQVFAAIKKEYEDITITCTAPSKTFNLASMMMSNIFIANPELRAKFRKQLDAAGTSQLGVMGLVACETAYNKGEEWYEAMLSYVKANAEFTKQYVEEQLPGVKMIDLEGTYLVWLDFRETGLSVDELEDLIINKAKLWLDSGKIFGDCGRGFQRINIACPRATLTEALERIRDAMKSR